MTHNEILRKPHNCIAMRGRFIKSRLAEASPKIVFWQFVLFIKFQEVVGRHKTVYVTLRSLPGDTKCSLKTNIENCKTIKLSVFGGFMNLL